MRIITLLILVGSIGISNSMPPTLKMRVDPNFIKIMTSMKKLQSKLVMDDLRTIVIMGLVQGAIEVKKSLEGNLTKTVTDFILNNENNNNSDKTRLNIQRIEKIIDRDRNSIEILGSALDLSRKFITMKEFQMDMKKLLMETKNRRRNVKRKRSNNVKNRMESFKMNVLEHVDIMRKTIEDKTNATISYIEQTKNISAENPIIRRMVSAEYPEEESVLKLILTDQTEPNVIDISRRQDTDAEAEEIEDKDQQKEELTEEEEFSAESNTAGGGGGGGGLGGLFGGSSGGEGESDAGALIGAITGLVTNLFGPGGLDVEALIGTASALFAGLLGRQRNFGTVLGEYVGTAVDGFSGGGGAINNGQFFGNFLGTVIAKLSADPEDDEKPIQPQIFIQSFVDSFLDAKSNTQPPEDGATPAPPTESGSFGFIKQLVRGILGGITNLIFNTSTSSSGGSGKGSSGTTTAQFNKLK